MKNLIKRKKKCLIWLKEQLQKTTKKEVFCYSLKCQILLKKAIKQFSLKDTEVADLLLKTNKIDTKNIGDYLLGYY